MQTLKTRASELALLTQNKIENNWIRVLVSSVSVFDNGDCAIFPLRRPRRALRARIALIGALLSIKRCRMLRRVSTPSFLPLSSRSPLPPPRSSSSSVVGSPHPFSPSPQMVYTNIFDLTNAITTVRILDDVNKISAEMNSAHASYVRTRRVPTSNFSGYPLLNSFPRAPSPLPAPHRMPSTGPSTSSTRQPRATSRIPCG